MNTIQFLAQLWGFSLVVVGLALLISQKQLRNMLDFMGDQNRFLMHAVMRIVLGIASVLTYNVWDNSWQVIITILGWLMLLSGLVMLFTPSFVTKMVQKLKNGSTMSFALTAAVIVGCVLIYFGING